MINIGVTKESHSDWRGSPRPNLFSMADVSVCQWVDSSTWCRNLIYWWTAQSVRLAFIQKWNYPRGIGRFLWLWCPEKSMSFPPCLHYINLSSFCSACLLQLGLWTCFKDKILCLHSAYASVYIESIICRSFIGIWHFWHWSLKGSTDGCGRFPLILGGSWLQAGWIPSLSRLAGVCSREGVVEHQLWTEIGCRLNQQVTAWLFSPVWHYWQPTYVWYFLSVGAVSQKLAGRVCTQHKARMERELELERGESRELLRLCFSLFSVKFIKRV